MPFTQPPREPRHPSEYDPEAMANTTLVIAAHVATFPEASAENFGALAEDARVAIAAVRIGLDRYRVEIQNRLADGRMSEGEYAAIYERVAGQRLAHDENLARLGAVSV